MAQHSIQDILVGILSFCPNTEIPADSMAMYKAFEKFSKIHPKLFSPLLNNTDKLFLERIEDEIDDLIFSGFIGLSGERLENLIISSDTKDGFDSNNFTKREVELLEEMGKRLPRMMHNNESQRYHKFKEMEIK